MLPLNSSNDFLVDSVSRQIQQQLRGTGRRDVMYVECLLTQMSRDVSEFESVQLSSINPLYLQNITTFTTSLTL